MLMICEGDLLQYKELQRSTVNDFLLKLENWIKKQKK